MTATQTPGRGVGAVGEPHEREPRPGPARTWTLRFAAPCAWLTANIERNRYDRSARVRQWREAVVAQCMAYGMPKGITPVTISVVVLYAGRAPVRDRLNLAPTIKALVDALTPPRTFTRAGKTYTTAGYGLLPDDDDKHVRATEWELVKLDKEVLGTGIGRVYLTITEVTGE